MKREELTCRIKEIWLRACSEKTNISIYDLIGWREITNKEPGKAERVTNAKH